MPMSFLGTLDIGTRLILAQIPASPDPIRNIDLGCGNSVVGLIAAERNPAAELIFVDESYMAVASAETQCSGHVRFHAKSAVPCHQLTGGYPVPKRRSGVE